jgi:formylglycine-generating enzyme required for sulfatase activity
MKVTLCLVFTIAMVLSAKAVNIQMVTVGNPGNGNDPADGDRNTSGVQHFGAVGYVYQIGKYEVTAGQYTEFLNAVAKTDPTGLYNPVMASFSQGAQIVQAGTSPNYVYSVAPDWTDRPVNFVGFWDVARFANWMHNGQPVGAQGPGTTEDGAYHDIGNEALFGRNPGARFFIPTENEWYKAAYHKNDGVTANYWLYPTASNVTPGNTLPDPGNHANFITSQPITGISNYTIGAPYWRTTVGVFENSASPYGTFDQGGNVQEWEEEVATSGRRRARGGFYALDVDLMHSSFRSSWDIPNEAAQMGFRIASALPEPSTLALAVGIFAPLAVYRRRPGYVLPVPARLTLVVIAGADRVARLITAAPHLQSSRKAVRRGRPSCRRTGSECSR